MLPPPAHACELVSGLISFSSDLTAHPCIKPLHGVLCLLACCAVGLRRLLLRRPTCLLLYGSFACFSRFPRAVFSRFLVCLFRGCSVSVCWWSSLFCFVVVFCCRSCNFGTSVCAFGAPEAYPAVTHVVLPARMVPSSVPHKDFRIMWLMSFCQLRQLHGVALSFVFRNALALLAFAKL